MNFASKQKLMMPNFLSACSQREQRVKKQKMYADPNSIYTTKPNIHISVGKKNSAKYYNFFSVVSSLSFTYTYLIIIQKSNQRHNPVKKVKIDRILAHLLLNF